MEKIVEVEKPVIQYKTIEKLVEVPMIVEKIIEKPVTKVEL